MTPLMWIMAFLVAVVVYAALKVTGIGDGR